MDPGTTQIIAAALFSIAVVHTFATKFFEHLAHTSKKHAGMWHLLGEVEVVFGFWAMVMMVFMLVLEGKGPVMDYLESRNFTEPMFVFAIMVVAGSKPILNLAAMLVGWLARLMPLRESMATYFLLLAFVPLLGSFMRVPNLSLKSGFSSPKDWMMRIVFPLVPGAGVQSLVKVSPCIMSAGCHKHWQIRSPAKIKNGLEW